MLGTSARTALCAGALVLGTTLPADRAAAEPAAGESATAAALHAARSDHAHRGYPGEDGLIAFVRQGQVFVVDPDGGDEQQLTDRGRNTTPRWGPHGRRLAFVHEKADGSRDIWLMRRDGTHLRQVTRHGDVTAPTWSPDGRWLAFGSPLQKVRAKAPFEQAVVLKGRMPNASPRPVAVESTLAWSPDGDTIAYYSDDYPRSPDHFLLTYDVASRRVSVFWEVGGTCCGEGYFADLAWTPDSRALGYTDGYYEPEAGPPPRRPRVSVFTAPGRERIEVETRRGDAQPAFAPSGRAIVLRHRHNGPPVLVVAAADGTGRRFLARGHHPDWQPLPAPVGGH